jgi:hypothetical protein
MLLPKMVLRVARMLVADIMGLQSAEVVVLANVLCMVESKCFVGNFFWKRSRREPSEYNVLLTNHHTQR